jgi:hypothetical protein
MKAGDMRLCSRGVFTWPSTNEYLNWDVQRLERGPVVLINSFVFTENGERRMWWVLSRVGIRCCSCDELDEFSDEVEQDVS